MYFLTKGTVKNYHEAVNGNFYIEDIEGAINIFGELEALVNKKVVTTVEAISSCEVIEIDNEVFLDWMGRDAKFSLFIAKLIAERNYECCKRERINAFYPMRYRVLYLMLNTFYKKDIIITKDLLVEGVGSNIRSINRIVNQLLEEGLIEYNSGIIFIKSKERLEEELNKY